MRKLIGVALLVVIPAAANAQGSVTLTIGFRGPAGPRFDKTRVGPLFGVDVKPIRWGWGALGIELSHAPRIAPNDSGAYSPAGQGCLGPDGIFTTCASSRRVRGEATSQLGAIARFGPQSRRAAPFVELGVGYYRTSQRDRIEIWDPSGRPLTNLSHDAKTTDPGVYARAGLGIEVKASSRGPALSLSARYRWAKRGSGINEWMEWFNERGGGEVVVGVRF
jgi:hypothetical protein